MTEKPIRVLCVDDNHLVADALHLKLRLEGNFEWGGWVREAEPMLQAARRCRAEVVLLDIDMPGRDVFEALRELVQGLPEARVLVFSGHVRPDFVERAIENGAWGYISKNDGEQSLIDGIRAVARGEFVLSPSVQEIQGKPRPTPPEITIKNQTKSFQPE